MNFTKENPERYFSVVVAKSTIFWLMSLLAFMTVLTHAAQILGISFRTYAFIGLGFLLITSLLSWFFFKQQSRKVTQYDFQTLLLLVVIGLGGAFISTFFNIGASRISYDLFYYAPNAVYHLQNPTAPMDFFIHYMETGGEPFLAYFGATSLPFEYSQAVISYFLNTSYLTTFFLFSPALLGFFITISYFYLLSQFVSPKSAAVGTLFAVAIILLLGETPRTPGTWSFPNVYIGKVFLISTGIPLFAGAAINFFRTFAQLDWMLLFAVTTALVGTTTSCMALLPALAAVLFIAYASVVGYRNISFRKVLAYALSQSYLLVYIVAILSVMNLHSTLGENSAVNEDFPITFLGHAGFLFEKSGPATPLALVGSTVVAILLASGPGRKFVIAWILAVIVLFLNPIVAPYVIKYLTTPNIYWRLFYIYPLPLLLGLTGARLFENISSFSRPARTGLIAGTAVALFISHFLPFTTSVLYLRTEFGWPRYKMPQAIEEQATGIISAVPAGPMLAPLPLNGAIVMLSGSYPQKRIFNEADRLWFGERGMSAEIDKRICASEFVNGDKPECLPAFRALLADSNLRSVVIAKSIARDSHVQSILNKNGFENYKEVGDLLAYWK